MTYCTIFTDPPWAISQGQVLSGWDELERSILGANIDIRVPKVANGRFTMAEDDVDLVNGAEAIVVYRQEVTNRLLDHAGPQLRVVIRQGVGFENLRADLLEARGILGIHVPDYCVSEVADHTLALSLALERDIVSQSIQLSNGVFDVVGGTVPRRLRDCTAGIVGFGRIGRAVAMRLRVVYGRVLVVDPFHGPELVLGYGCQPVSLKEALQQADLLTLHCDLNGQTRGIISAHALNLMKPTARLVNAARGALIDSNALRDAILKGRLAGAALDVFVPENPHDDSGCWSELLELPNVIGTSHRAFLSSASVTALRRRTAEAIRDVLERNELPLVGVVTRRTIPLGIMS